MVRGSAYTHYVWCYTFNGDYIFNRVIRQRWITNGDIIIISITL